MSAGAVACAEAEVAPRPAVDPASLAAANINPVTGLSTDYLNHFSEAIMLLEMLPAMPECLSDLVVWRPRSYQDHFAGSHLSHRALAIAAYDLAAPNTRAQFEALGEAMNIKLRTACAVVASDLPPPTVATALEEAVAGLKRLVARASAVINGLDDDPNGTQPAQAAVDAILHP